MFFKRTIQVALILVMLAAPFAMTQKASAGSGPYGYCSSTYVVQPGDWLSKIAAKCGVTLSALYAANPWAQYYYYIYPGQVLTIPGTYNPPAYPAPGSSNPAPGGNSYCGPTYSEYYGNYYVVCRGDTLSGIAWYYGESLSYIQWHNGIANPNLIYSGQFIWP